MLSMMDQALITVKAKQGLVKNIVRKSQERKSAAVPVHKKISNPIKEYGNQVLSEMGTLSPIYQ